MTLMKTAGMVLAGAGAIVLASAPVSAKPVHHKRHRVCKIERFHGHKHKVCHWVG